MSQLGMRRRACGGIAECTFGTVAVSPAISKGRPQKKSKISFTGSEVQEMWVGSRTCVSDILMGGGKSLLFLPKDPKVE